MGADLGGWLVAASKVGARLVEAPSSELRRMRSRLPSVLVVDDDQGIRVALERALSIEGFSVSTVADGHAALDAVQRERCDLVVLDVAMPGLDGVSVTRRLRSDGRELPILILSALDEVDDRVAGLQAGADDYLVKPFAVNELVARLHALLRRRREPELTRREFELLATFARHPGIVLSRSQLLRQVWGYDFAADGNVVDVFVGYLRRKLEADGEPRMLHTVRGVGFVLRP